MPQVPEVDFEIVRIDQLPPERIDRMHLVRAIGGISPASADAAMAFVRAKVPLGAQLDNDPRYRALGYCVRSTEDDDPQAVSIIVSYFSDTEAHLRTKQ